MVAALQKRKACFSSGKASFHLEHWLGETPLGPIRSREYCCWLWNSGSVLTIMLSEARSVDVGNLDI